MIDFDALVLGPAMDAFARPVTVFPKLGSAYQARGVWKIENVDVPLQDGIYSAQVRTLGVRLSELPAPAEPGDRVVVDDLELIIDDTDDDGNGGSIWTFKESPIVK